MGGGCVGTTGPHADVAGSWREPVEDVGLLLRDHSTPTLAIPVFLLL